ncbi:uncharacterized protein Z518_10250 [Rhinocladiella mackenziei CBS 650.93]|uniref:DUF4387 domain-containing protein n=1 Tax=Rhinocladiella mackenziei CBS 650.93 TaxID=1442369 RepID=A0A0D2GP47_9EURO|nr:uncharacterized protein Z518_10250 [Rhinocladiella mackenziei CBS 650.93]KIX00113.1 hypothetical protein Z518_10250 [Rhinocladiella mackenziei CBS 650.93]
MRLMSLEIGLALSKKKGLKRLLENGDERGDRKTSLPELSDILRPKNAGLYEITFDIIFYSMDCQDHT